MMNAFIFLYYPITFNCEVIYEMVSYSWKYLLAYGLSH